MHTFDPEVAIEFGVIEAIVIKSFQFWLSLHHENGTHRYDGRTWCYNSAKALQKFFPYLSRKQIYSVITRLETAGVLVTGNYNRTGFDQTRWYAFADEARWLCPSGNHQFTKRENGSPKKGTPIPDSTTVKNTDSTQSPPRAREAVFVVTADGMCLVPEIPVIPEIPVVDAPAEKPESARPSRSEPDRDWQRWVDRFEVHVKKHNDGLGHHWTKIQFGPQGLKGIRTHLVKISTKLPDNSDDDCGYLAWCYVLDHWADLGDEWLGKQFDLTVVLKKITDILNRLKNAATTNRVTPAGGNGKVSTSQARNEALRDY